jgi:hypothetical protein
MWTPRSPDLNPVCSYVRGEINYDGQCTVNTQSRGLWRTGLVRCWLVYVSVLRLIHACVVVTVTLWTVLHRRIRDGCSSVAKHVVTYIDYEFYAWHSTAFSSVHTTVCLYTLVCSHTQLSNRCPRLPGDKLFCNWQAKMNSTGRYRKGLPVLFFTVMLICWLYRFNCLMSTVVWRKKGK